MIPSSILSSWTYGGNKREKTCLCYLRKSDPTSFWRSRGRKYPLHRDLHYTSPAHVSSSNEVHRALCLNSQAHESCSHPPLPPPPANRLPTPTGHLKGRAVKTADWLPSLGTVRINAYTIYIKCLLCLYKLPDALYLAPIGSRLPQVWSTEGQYVESADWLLSPSAKMY